jgi:hypothetical protein
MDRNLIQSPLQLNGVVYAKGLGADSGSSMLYRDWQSVWNTRHEKARQANHEAAALLGAKAVLTGKPAAGLRVRVDGQVWNGKPQILGADQSLLLEWSRPTGAVLIGADAPTGVQLNGIPLERLTPDRIEHLTDQAFGDMPAARCALTYRASERPMILGGKIYFGGVSAGFPVRLLWETPLASAATLPVAAPAPKPRPGTKPAAVPIFLQGRVGLDRQAGTPCGTARFLVILDGKTVFDSGPMTPLSHPIFCRIPYPTGDNGQTLPVHEVRLVVSDMGDGGYSDNANWGELSVLPPEAPFLSAPLPLSGFRPWSWRQNWGIPQWDRAASGEVMTFLPNAPQILPVLAKFGIGVAAPSEIVYRELPTQVTHRVQSAQTLAGLGWTSAGFHATGAGAAPPLPRQPAPRPTPNAAASPVTDPATRRTLEQLLRDDPEFADLSLALAFLVDRTGDSKAGITYLKRVLDIGRAAAPEMRLTAQLALCEAQAGRPLPTQSLPERLRSLQAQPPHILAFGRVADLTAAPRLLTCLPELNDRLARYATQRTVISLAVRGEEAGKRLNLLLASGGLEVCVWLLPADPTLLTKSEMEWEARALARASGRNPSLHCTLPEGQVALVITHEGARDGLYTPFTIGLAASLTNGLTRKPTEQWHYALQNDGSAQVGLATDAPTAFLLPNSAEEVTYADAQTVVVPSAFAYGSTLEFPYTMGDTVLLVPQAGHEAKARFVWRDAAYDVPMSHYATDHAKKHHFVSLRGINLEAQLMIGVTLPPTVTRVLRIAPEPIHAPEGGAEEERHWSLTPDRSVLIEAQNPALESRWISAKHRHMTVWMPDTKENRLWLEPYREMLAKIYDRQSLLMGDYEADEELFLYLTGPAQLSGYGGATWADPRVSETWIGSTGRVGAYNLLAQPGGDSIEAHELKWVHLPGATNLTDAPYWLRRGLTLWLEEEGKRAGDTGFPDQFTWTELAPRAQQYLAGIQGRGKESKSKEEKSAAVWLSDADIAKLPAAERERIDGMCWHILNALREKYGDAFWNKFWKFLRENPPDWKSLEENEKTHRILEEMIKLTDDPALKEQFIEWGFR